MEEGLRQKETSFSLLRSSFLSRNRMVSRIVSTVGFIEYESASRWLVIMLKGAEVNPCELDTANKLFPDIFGAAAA